MESSAYVYYRIDPEQAQLAARRIDALLNTMAAHCSAPPRRLSRCDDAATWMEIYEGIADFAAFTEALERATADAAGAAFILGERHLECFTAPVPAA
ncbi:MAG: DUF4936 family protein [Thiobacillus sp.]|nr:DUF4936 family protein [Thiobacillus sp.]